MLELPDILVVMALARGSAQNSPGWAVALIGLDIAGACIAMTAVITRKGKQVAVLRSSRPKAPTAP